MRRVIFHIDINAFFAACAVKANPQLAGRPIVIARRDVFYKSIITCPSYPARKYGVKTAMPLYEAFQRCPVLEIVEPDYPLYEREADAFFAYLRTITPVVEPLSIDEGFLDVTGRAESYLALAEKIQSELFKTHGLPVSIGIGPNKFLAKMASDYKKPLGITVFSKRNLASTLWPLPIGAMYGVGKKTGASLAALGIETIGDLAHFPAPEQLEQAVGKAAAASLYRHAWGHDDSPVDPFSAAAIASLSQAHTFNSNVFNTEIILDTLKVLTNSLCARLEVKNRWARTVGIQIKYADFRSASRSVALAEPARDAALIWPELKLLFEDFYTGSELRLIGVFASRLTTKPALPERTLFSDWEGLAKEEAIKKIVARVNEHYPQAVLKIGVKDETGND